MILQKAYKPIDNAPLLLFRIILGALIMAQCFLDIKKGWVKTGFIDPTVSLPFIGFEFLVPFPGIGMYVYFAIMGICGLAVLLGYKYRFSLLTFTVLWTGIYLMQKTYYNNHYYLLILVCIIMFFLPANRYASLDVKFNQKLKSLSMPQWCSWILILQMAIVYFFGAVAKLYPDWLNGTVTGILFPGIANHPLVAFFFKGNSFALFIAYAGILFDALIIPALLWKKTRNYAVIAGVFFHLFNSYALSIGIFPYFAFSTILFFYPPETIRKLFFRKKPSLEGVELPNYNSSKIILWIFILFFILQMMLPLRHWFIKGDVLWTEEGHRMSWRMMLRDKKGKTSFRVLDKKTNQQITYDLKDKLTKPQLAFVATKPDGMWQMAQHIKKEFAQKGIEVQIFIDSELSINRKPYKLFIDPRVDFAQAKWNYFRHNDWIILYDDQGNRIPK